MKIIKFLLIVVFFSITLQNYLFGKENKLTVEKISKNLRCLICQGQSVYDSQSDFANSVKIIIKKKIEQGKSENEIYEFFTNKYGEWIVYDPKLNIQTVILWIFPLILFIFGGLLIIRKVFIN